MIRKLLASVLSAALLVAQQGFIGSASAAMAVSKAASAASSSAAGAAGAAAGAHISKIPLNNLSLNNAGLVSTVGTLPSLKTLDIAPNIAAAADLSQGAVAQTVLPAAIIAAESKTALNSADKLVAGEAVEAKAAPSTLGKRVARLGRSILGGASVGRAPFLKRFFDSSKLRAESKDGVEASGEADFGRDSGLSRQPTIGEFHQILVDGTIGEHGRIGAFGFREPSGEHRYARTPGLEAFFAAKFEHEEAHGEGYGAWQVNDYFNYLEALLKPIAWTKDLRRELRSLNRLNAHEKFKNEELNKVLLRMLTRLQRQEFELLMENSDAPKTLAEASIDIDPARKYYPSPADWRDEVVYFAMIDRFSRGKGAVLRGDPRDGQSRHGGNIQGTIDRLDYIAASGVTTLLLTPVTAGLPMAYHGYAPLHLLAIDPHLGTMGDYKRLVQEAHKRGIRVVLDLILNHTGPAFEYKGGSEWRGVEGAPKEISEWTFPLKPEELAAPEHFSRRGVIDDWNHPDQVIRGDFPPNYRHFKSEDPQTQEFLIKIALWWMKEADVDGFRLDAIRHMDPSFRPRFNREVRAFAQKLGKNNFFLLGENSTGADSDLLPFLGPEGFDSLYDYPSYRRDNMALHGAAPTRYLEDSLKASVSALGAGARHLLRFIDLHDTYRFLRSNTPAGLLKLAFAYMLFSTGIPIVYAGTEQAFRQATDSLAPEGPHEPADPQNREDMFPEGEFKSASSKGDKFDTEAPSFRVFKRLAELRKKHPALRRGEMKVIWSDPDGPGIYAFSRVHEGEEVLVVMNTADKPRSASMWVDAERNPGGTAFVDELAPDYGNLAETPLPGRGPQESTQSEFRTRESRIHVTVPAHGVRILVHQSRQ